MENKTKTFRQETELGGRFYSHVEGFIPTLRPFFNCYSTHLSKANIPKEGRGSIFLWGEKKTSVLFLFLPVWKAQV